VTEPTDARALPKGRKVEFALYQRNMPIDMVVADFRRAHGTEPDHVAVTGGGILAGPLPQRRHRAQAPVVVRAGG
jgi:hypothetical protein